MRRDQESNSSPTAKLTALNPANFQTYLFFLSSRLFLPVRHTHSCQFPSRSMALKPGTAITEPDSCFVLAEKESLGLDHRVVWGSGVGKGGSLQGSLSDTVSSLLLAAALFLCTSYLQPLPHSVFSCAAPSLVNVFLTSTKAWLIPKPQIYLMPFYGAAVLISFWEQANNCLSNGFNEQLP